LLKKEESEESEMITHIKNSTQLLVVLETLTPDHAVDGGIIYN